MYRNRAVILDGIYVNYQISVKAMLKLATSKAGTVVRILAGFLESEERPSKDLISSHVNPVNNSTIIPAKFYQPKTKKLFTGMGYSATALPANISDSVSKKYIDHLGNSADMSPAQVVFAVIHKQQIEWMMSTEKI